MNELNYYLSSHGTTHLYTLLVDNKRDPPVFDIQGIPSGVEVEIHYKIKGGQMQSVLSRHDSLSKSTKRDETKLDKRVYNDYMIINAKGYGREGKINQITLMKGDKKYIFYDRQKDIIINIPNVEYSYEDDNFSTGLLELEKSRKHDLEPKFLYEGICQMKEDYELDDTVILKRGTKIFIIDDDTVEKFFNEPGDDPNEWLYIRYKINGKTKNLFLPKRKVKPKFYTSSAFDPGSHGFLHSSLPGSWTKNETSSPSTEYSKAYEDQSLLNMIFNGGKRNWDNSLYLDYPGCKNKLNKGEKYIINIYGSHCLNAETYEEHLSFSNVIPFVLKMPEWSELFQDELSEGAKKEVGYYEDLAKPVYEGRRSEERERTKGIDVKLKNAERALKAMMLLNKQGLGPILDKKVERKTKRKNDRELNTRSNKNPKARIKKSSSKSKKLKFIEATLKKIILNKTNSHNKSSIFKKASMKGRTNSPKKKKNKTRGD